MLIACWVVSYKQQRSKTTVLRFEIFLSSFQTQIFYIVLHNQKKIIWKIYAIQVIKL